MIETEVRMVIWPQKRCSNHYKLWGASKGSAGLRKPFVCLSFINVFGEPKTHFGDLQCQRDRETDRHGTEGCRPARYGGGGGGGGGRRPAAGGPGLRRTWAGVRRHDLEKYPVQVRTLGPASLSFPLHSNHCVYAK